MLPYQYKFSIERKNYCNDRHNFGKGTLFANIVMSCEFRRYHIVRVKRRSVTKHGFDLILVIGLES